MKTIDVKEQPKLNVNRTIDISINGIRYRMFRSVVTVMVIAVAIAFMMNILCEAIITRSVSQTVDRMTAEKRQTDFWAARLSKPGTPESLLQEVATYPIDHQFNRENQQFSDMSDAEFSTFATNAKVAANYLTFISKLEYGRRRVLIGNAVGVQVFDQLQGKERLDAFTRTMTKLKLRYPGSREELAPFLQAWPDMKVRTITILDARTAAIASFADVVAVNSLADALIDAKGDFGNLVTKAGFSSFDDTTRAVVAEQARQIVDIRTLEDSLQLKPVRAKLAATLDVLPGQVNAQLLWKSLRNRTFSGEYLGQLKKEGLDISALSADRLVELSKFKSTEALLERANSLTVDEDTSSVTGLSSRMTWLVLVSLLVCIVGISNAMLMTVTERFREIATLKCLGALDGFIMALFVIEACLLGIVGGALGSLIGSFIGIGRMFLSFGAILWPSFPVGGWLVSLLLSIVVGMVLAALAGVYPSYVAARLAPMEAMRIE